MHTFHDNDNLVPPPPLLRDLPPKTRRPLSYPSGPESLPLPGGEDEEDEDEELQVLEFLDLTSTLDPSRKRRKRNIRRLSNEPSFTIEEDHSSSPCSSSDKLITPEKKKTSPRIRPFGQESLTEKKRKRKVAPRNVIAAAATAVDDNDDADGAQQLPDEFEPFPAELYGRPLEEVDNFIYDATFCVVSRRFRKHYIHRFTASNSFFIFSPFNPIRNACVYVITNQFFDYLVMTTILFNCILLAMTETIEEAEYIFLGIYSMEMVIKSIAKGFILDKYSYLRSPWNWLDFIVISSGYVTICVQSGANLSGLRTFRVLRALKTISILPGLKTIINALLHSFKQLAEVMTLTLFCLMVFALFALQVYKGELRNKCVLKMTDDGYTQVSWLNWTSNPDNWLWEDSQESPILCGNVTGSRRCSPTHTCISIGENPNYGYTSFDNFFWSMLTTFQLITLDYWENVYNMVLATCGPMSISFFTVVVFFGSFYLVNLMLAVVALSYEEEADIAHEEKKKELMDHRNDSTFSFNPTAAMGMKRLTRKKEIGSRIKGRKGMLLAYRRKNTRRRRRKRLEMGSRIGCEQQGDNASDCTMNNNPNPNNGGSPGTAVVTNLPSTTAIPSPPPSSSSPFSDSLQPTSETALALPKSHIRCRQARVDDKQSSLDDSGVVVVDEVDDEKQKEEKSDSENKQREETTKETQLGALIIKCNGTGMNRSNLIKKEQKKMKRQSTQCTDFSQVIVISDEATDRNCSCCRNYSCWMRFQQQLYKIVKDPIFELIITVCIVLNTIVLALEHHGMSQSILKALDIGNKVFTAIFTIECFLKIVALNEEFFGCGWNVFDLMIVSASLLDLIFELVDGLSVLRGLRLLRVLKLAQSWMTMRVLLSIIISTIGALGNLTFVLVIVIYIFAVIGMQLFAKDYTEEKFFPDPVPRWNFTDFFHSFMMIFRILCGEWIEPLWDCMRAERTEGPGICLAVFLPTLVMGNFMVLNLFLALLLNNFNSEELRNRKEVVGDESKMARTLQRIRELMLGAKRDGELDDQDLERKLSHFEDVAREVVICQRQLKQEDEAEIYDKTQHFPRDKISYLEAMNRPISIISYSEYQDAPSRRGSKFLEPTATPRKYISITTAPQLQTHCGEIPIGDSSIIAKQQCSTNESSNKNNENAAGDLKLTERKTNESDAMASRPWQTLVSYVDEITVGGRNSNSEREMELSGTYSGEKKRSEEPPDCFPTQFYEKCVCLKIYCIQNNSKTATNWKMFRRWILSIVDTPAFEWFVLALIFASSVTLCFEDVHLDENPDLKSLLYWTNLTFSVIFLMEMIFKWIAFGFYKYFSGFWTLLDFFIVSVSFFSLLIEENENLRALRSLRTLRALRPLRAISRWQGMRIVVNALMYAIPSIFNVLLVCLVFWLIFSIMGVQFFSGKFYKCLDDDGERLDTEVVNNRLDCERLNYTWRNSKISFDHVGVAYLALFQVATFEGWMEVMADAVDARGVDLQPKRESNLYAYIYFIIFIVCGSFFTLNLFIGVIIDNFNMLKKKYEGGVLEIFLTENQKHYYTAMKKLSRKKPQKVIRRPTNAVLATFYDLANSRRFEIAIFTLIFLNMISMAVEHHNQAEAVIFVLEVSNAFFTTVFGLECIVKIMGLRHHYFTVPWNVFDFLLVIASILGILMEDAPREFPVSPTLLRVVRVFRIGRILRLIKAAKGIRKLLFALIVSLPALFNIGALLALITFIYAIIGMFLFGHVRRQGALDDMVNFETFGRSTHLLFRLITSAGWNDVLESLMVQYPDCDPHFRGQSNGDCGYPLLSIVYLTSFIIINHMIVINMYIAVILENFNQAHQEEEIGIVEDDLEMFYVRWSRYDPHATQFIRFCQLSDFIASLDAPLGIPKPNTVALVSFDLPIAKGEKIHCLDVLHALVKHVLGHVEETEYFRQLQQQMNLKFKKQFPTRKRLEVVSSTRIWKRRETAAKIIQKAWKDYLIRKKEKEKEAMRTFSSSSTSPPGDWKSRLSTLFLHVHRGGTGSGGGSRGSSRKSSRASDVSNGDARSMSGGPWLNLPLLLFSNVATATANVPYSLSSPVDMASDEDRLNQTVQGSPSTVPTRRRSLYDYFFLRHQDAIDKVESPLTPRKEMGFLRPDMVTPSDDHDDKEDDSLILSKNRLGVRRNLISKKRFGSFSISSTSSQRTGGTPVSILVTKASPENAGSNNDSEPLSPPENKCKSTVVQVLVHRESSEDEYNRAEEREAEQEEEERHKQEMEDNKGQIDISPLSSPTFSSSSVSSSLREINKDS